MARKYTKRNTEYWKKNTGYSAYLKEFKRLEKEVRRGAGVKTGTTWKQGIYKAGTVAEFDVRTPMMNRAKYNRYSAKYANLSPEQIAGSQFNLLSDDLAKTIMTQLTEAGLDTYTDASGNVVQITEIMIKTRQLPQEVWDKMELYAKQTGLDMGYFFGS